MLKGLKPPPTNSNHYKPRGTMAPSTSAAARETPRRGGPTILNKGIRTGASLFRGLFPDVHNKKTKRWKFHPEKGYRLVNDLRKRHGDAVPRDRRLDNALSHRATANAREMVSSDGAPANLPIAAPIYLYKPEELSAALAGGHPDNLARTLVVVNTTEGADVLTRQGYQRFSQVNQYDTMNSGLSQLPDDSSLREEAASGRPLPTHELPAPAGSVRSLPKKMPALYKPGPGESERSMAEIVLECFEEKVIDVERKQTWHPICMWPSGAKERKKLGYDDAAGLNNRVKAYCTVKSQKYTHDELKNKKLRELVDMAVEVKSALDFTGTYFDLAKKILNSEDV